MSFEQAPDEQASSERASSRADSPEAGFEVELQHQLHLFRNRILGEIHHEGQIIQGELRRNRLLMTDELETARDHLQHVVSSVATQLVMRVNLALVASIVVIVVLMAEGRGL